MRLSIFAAGMLALAVPAVALAASQPIKVYPGFMNACPKQIGPPASPGVVCTQNVVVSGGVPHSGYTFKVKPGTTLPPGIFLMATTGVLTATTSNPLLPRAGQRIIWLTVSDGSKTGTGHVTLQMETGSVCGCPVFSGGSGALPDARANQPYAIALPVSGPSSFRVLRPNYTWTATGKLPPGVVLDRARGVLRGTPLGSTSGHDYSFTVDITENVTGFAADVFGPYTLHVQ